MQESVLIATVLQFIVSHACSYKCLPQLLGATVNGGNGIWKRKRKVETENGNGKRKREMVVTAIRTQYKLSMPG